MLDVLSRELRRGKAEVSPDTLRALKGRRVNPPVDPRVARNNDVSIRSPAELPHPVPLWSTREASIGSQEANRYPSENKHE